MRIPAATYRLQLNREFTFQQGADIAGYLKDLGITDCYASPLFKPTPQSSHGYDVCDFNSFNPDLGTRRDFYRFSARLRSLGLGLLMDMVANHMAANTANPWWWDVLENGPASAYAAWFDIEWYPADPKLQGKVLLPVLEDCYTSVLASGKLRVVFNQGKFALNYFGRNYPLSPVSCAGLLNGASKGGRHQASEAKLALAAATQRTRVETSPDHPASQTDSAITRSEIQAALGSVNGIPGQTGSFERLDALLQQQHYQLASWRSGSARCNYRRFFDVNDLVGLRMELPEVFHATHKLLLDCVGRGQVTGLRIDHPDGLWDPKQYLQRLQASAARPHALNAKGLYVVVEKILASNEPLPTDWPIAGTTGYDFLVQVNGLFVNAASAPLLNAFYHEFTGCKKDFASVAYHSKRAVLETAFVSAVDRLVQRIKNLAVGAHHRREHTTEELRRAVATIIAAFPVYRTYFDGESKTTPGREYIRQALRRAKRGNREVDPAVFDFVGTLLLRDRAAGIDGRRRHQVHDLVMKFQQLTPSAMAKGVEDTAFYTFNRLISLNEVGGDPGKFGMGVHEFHQANLHRARHWPFSLLATATHDTKRGEDARARINVLSEMPQEWAQAVNRWSRLNEGKKAVVDGQAAPHRNDEYLLYQTLLGAWPMSNAGLVTAQTDSSARTNAEHTAPASSDPSLSSPSDKEAAVPAGFCERICAYMLKAVREAKSHTSWTNPNSAYEQATREFVERLLTPDRQDPFLRDFVAFLRKPMFFGRFNSLSQTLLKMTAPGVPDFYQGTELWDFSLVDPDNRRPVNYEPRRRLLRELREAMHADSTNLSAMLARLLKESHSGQTKLYLIWRTLNYRNSRRGLFENGRYLPLNVVGSKKSHVCAFARVWKAQTALVIAPRLVASLMNGAAQPPIGEVWGATRLSVPDARPGDRYRNLLTEEVLEISSPNGTIPVSRILALFPAALLEKVSPDKIKSSSLVVRNPKARDSRRSRGRPVSRVAVPLAREGGSP